MLTAYDAFCDDLRTYGDRVFAEYFRAFIAEE